MKNPSPTLFHWALCVQIIFQQDIYNPTHVPIYTHPIKKAPPTLFLRKCGILYIDPYIGRKGMFCVFRQNNIWHWLSLSGV
jgi:hypothetical protein